MCVLYTGLSLPPGRLTSEDIVLSVSLCCHCAESMKRKRREAWAEAAKRVKLVGPSSCDCSSMPHCIIDFLQQALPFWPVHAAALAGQHHASIVWGLRMLYRSWQGPAGRCNMACWH